MYLSHSRSIIRSVTLPCGCPSGGFIGDAGLMVGFVEDLGLACEFVGTVDLAVVVKKHK